jgi:peptide/nickel transport system permease protein
MVDISLSTALAGTGESDVPPSRSRGYWPTVRRNLRRDPRAIGGGLLLLLLVIGVVGAPLIAPADPYHASILARLKPIGTAGHLLGTDELGRDMLSRLLYGGQSTFLMGVAPVLIAFLVGGTLGLVAGCAGGVINMMIMRAMDVLYAFPSVLLAVALSGALGSGIGNAMLALTLVFVAPIARVAESAATEISHLDFVDAARASGASAVTIVRVHVLGHVLGPVIVYASSLSSLGIVLAAGLSFLGLGVIPPRPDWGLMLSTLRQSIYIQPIVAALPGFVIFVTSISLNMLSDALRDAMMVKK